jgi:hypothetical protein
VNPIPFLPFDRTPAIPLPGLEDYADVVTILQPVLGWNSDHANAWSIASWNCCVSGTVFEAAPTRVNMGDKIASYMGHLRREHFLVRHGTCSPKT